MKKLYQFEITGTAAAEQTWSASGTVLCEFGDVLDAAMASTFKQLTDGKAVYGKPGVGCRGPYEIVRVVIERAKQ